jgi:hypothetical protein
VNARHQAPHTPGTITRLRAALPGQLRRVGTARLVAGTALVAAMVTGGAGIAVAASHNLANRPAPYVADRAATDRAGRDHTRPSGSPSASPVSPAPASPAPSSAAPSPTALPATPAPAPTTTAPSPKKTTTIRPAVPAGCASYAGNQLTACQLLPSFGFATSEMAALVPMWNHESGWDATAENPGSGAYGIPQALPGSKMSTAGSDWRTNPATQIRWGLGYIKSVYGSPSAAWSFWQNNGWY